MKKFIEKVRNTTLVTIAECLIELITHPESTDVVYDEFDEYNGYLTSII